METPDEVFARAKRMLADAEAAGRKPFGWVAHSSLFHQLLAARRKDDPDPQIKYRYLLLHRLFFSDELPRGTLELIFDEPTEPDGEPR